MSSKVTIEIPREVMHATRLTSGELRRELVFHLFQQGKLSLGKAREVAGMTVWTFLPLLASRDIPIHYDVEDFEADLATLEESDQL